jgi:adenylate kinase
VETGELLRRESERETELGRQVRPYLQKGELAPTELVEKIVARSLQESSAPLALFDGFPRNTEEVESLERLEQDGRLRLAAVLVLHLTRESAVERISGRRVCPDWGAAYDRPPARSGEGSEEEQERCYRCGASPQQRPDDRPEVVNRRLDVFERETLPAVEILQARRQEIVHNLSAEADLEKVVDRAAEALNASGLTGEAGIIRSPFPG